MTVEKTMQWFLGITAFVAWIVTEATNCHVDKLPETAIGIIGTLVVWNAGATAVNKVKSYKLTKK